MELTFVARLPSALHHFSIYLLALFSFVIKYYLQNCEHDLEMFIFLHSLQSYTTSQLKHTGDISFGEIAHDERDNLLAGGSWPTLDNSSRLNRHTWSASQPSAGTMGVWCIDPPTDQPLPRLGLDSVQVTATYAVISEPVPNRTHLMFLLPETKHSCKALQFELNQEYKRKLRVKDNIESLLIWAAED